MPGLQETTCEREAAVPARAAGDVAGSPWPAPPDAPLRDLLVADLACVRRRRQRDWLLVAATATSVLPVLSTWRPGLLPPALRDLSILAWAGAVLLALLVASSEWAWRRRLTQSAEELRRGAAGRPGR